MLLRRIITNLRVQNWLAVCLDLVIVIIGIFLGLQASQWYEARQDVAQETVIVQLLQTEFRQISDVVDTAIRFHQDEIQALQLLHQSLSEGELAPNSEAIVQAGLQDAMSFDPGPGRSSTYTEIVSTGQFQLLRDRELRSALSRYDEHVMKSDWLFSSFQQSQRNYEAELNRHVIYTSVTKQKADSMPTGIEYFHGGIASFDFEAMAKDEEALVAIRRLIEYHVNYQFWHGQINQFVDAILLLLESKRS